jgi:hypothetical protein
MRGLGKVFCRYAGIKRDIGGIRGFLDLSIFVKNVGGLLDMLSSASLKKENQINI